MGYYTEIEGDISLDKPLTEKDAKDLADTLVWGSADGRPDSSCPWEYEAATVYGGPCIHWDGCEKPYEYDKWLMWLVDKFFAPRGYVLNGDAEWQGEDDADMGMMRVKDNNVQVGYGKKVYTFDDGKTWTE